MTAYKPSGDEVKDFLKKEEKRSEGFLEIFVAFEKLSVFCSVFYHFISLIIMLAFRDL